MSRASAAPRRTGFSPTGTMPDSAAADQHRREERGVLQQHTDVGRAVGIEARLQRGSDRGAVPDVVTPAGEPSPRKYTPRSSTSASGVSRSVTVGRPSLTDQAGVSANSRPMRSSCPVALPTANSVCLAARKYRCTGWSSVDPDAAVHVNGGVRDAVSGVGRPERGRADVDVCRQVLRQPPRRLGQRQPQGLDVDVAVGQSRRDGLEAADRPVELLALAGVVRRELQRPLEHAELIGAAAEGAMGGRARRHHAPWSPPTTRAASTPCSSRCPTLPCPVVSRAVTVTPASSLATRKTLVPESVSAGTRNASATGP